MSSIVAASHAVSAGELVGPALHSGADRVSGVLLGRLLLRADAEFAGRGAHGGGKPTVRVLSVVLVLGLSRAGTALALDEPATISGAAVGEEVR